MTAPAIEDLLRELTPQVLGVLVRRHGQFDGCEDAVQEAVLAATVQWLAEGVPHNPRGWLVTVASRRLIDQLRSDRARRQRESAMAAEVVAGHHRLLSVRAHLREKTGDPSGAYEHSRRAARATASIAEQRYLESRASRVRT